MARSFVGAAAAAVLGALAGAAGLALVYRSAPGVSLPLDRPAPHVLAGVYGVERSGELTFVWTGPQASVSLPGLDRHVTWRCAVRLRGGRAAGVTQPTVAIDVDGVPGARVTATNLFEDVAVDVPPRPGQDGLALTIASTPTFVPGPGDRRELGVQVDHIACAPTDGIAWPPRRALVVAATAAATFAGALVVLGAPLWLALVAATAVAGAQALAIAAGPAPYTPYLDRVPWLASLPTVAAVTMAGAIAWRTGRNARPEVRFVLAYSSVALYLLLLAVLHPSKALIDAQFHAHRLEWVHSGRYFFTQPMPDGVAFPYAIALYVVSMPWMALTRDHVALLRIVVCTTHILAGLLLYVAIVRRWQDRLAGALAVVLWSLVPQWFLVVGNANLTAAFAQSAATATLLTAAILTLGSRDVLHAVALFLLASVAFLSHVGTFPLLLVTLGLLAMSCWWLGGDTERAPARWIAVTAVAAAIFSVVAYYGQFVDVYRSLYRVSGHQTTVAGAASSGATGGVAPVPGVLPRGGPTPSTAIRIATCLDVGVEAVGWPLVLLALVGAGRLIATRSRSRLTLAALAWAAAGAAFLAAAVLMPVEDRFYRYNVEFIGRVYYATWPAVIVVAAVGGAWAWRAHMVWRAAGAALVAGAVAVAAQQWWDWIG